MIRRPPRSTLSSSSAASDVYKRQGHDSHRTSGLLREDLDELAEAFDGYEGDLKVQIAGPWTLASSIWLHRGERSVVDAGATRDVIASLAEGLRVHLDEVAQLVQMDAQS